MEIFVGNLPFASTEDDLQRHFEAFGAVQQVIIVRDRETGRSRGFGFVTMPNDTEARDAIEGLATVANQVCMSCSLLTLVAGVASCLEYC